MSFSSLSSLLYSSRVRKLSGGGVVCWLRSFAHATSYRSKVPATYLVLVLIVFSVSIVVLFSFCFLGCESAQVVDHVPAVLLAKSLLVGWHRLFAFGQLPKEGAVALVEHLLGGDVAGLLLQVLDCRTVPFAFIAVARPALLDIKRLAFCQRRFVGGDRIFLPGGPRGSHPFLARFVLLERRDAPAAS